MVGCGRTSATSRPSTKPSPRSTEPSESRARRSSAFVVIVQPRRAELEEIARRIDAGSVRPVVGAAFPLADAIGAYQTKPLRGKVVLRVEGAGALPGAANPSLPISIG